MRVAASPGMQQVLDAAGMSAADLAELRRDGFEMTFRKRLPARVCQPSCAIPGFRDLRLQRPQTELEVGCMVSPVGNEDGTSLLWMGLCPCGAPTHIPMHCCLGLWSFSCV